jgi:hypothetical protein
VFFGNSLVRGAHLPTFRFYMSGFAKDSENCYYDGRKKIDANPSRFRGLNFAFAADDNSVWTAGGRVEEADPATFAACDEGILDRGDYLMPAGYGKDKDAVFYLYPNARMKAKRVRNADPRTFVSLQDAYFGKDDSLVFCNGQPLAKAKVHCWARLGNYYSKDDSRVFYFNRYIGGADLRSFEVMPLGASGVPMARDNINYYRNDTVVDKSEFLKWVACPACFQNTGQLDASDASWCATPTVIDLARGIYAERAFDRMPILADALEDAGGTNEVILAHCRGPGPHVRGCWVVDLLLGKK